MKTTTTKAAVIKAAIKVVKSVPFWCGLLVTLCAAFSAVTHAETPEEAAESRATAAKLLDEAKRYAKDDYDDGRAFLTAARARAVISVRSPRQWNDEDSELVERANQQMRICSKRLQKRQKYLDESVKLEISYLPDLPTVSEKPKPKKNQVKEPEPIDWPDPWTDYPEIGSGYSPPSFNPGAVSRGTSHSYSPPSFNSGAVSRGTSPGYSPPSLNSGTASRGTSPSRGSSGYQKSP